MGEAGRLRITLYNLESNSLRTVRANVNGYIGCKVILLREARSAHRKLSELSDNTEAFPSVTASESFYNIGEKMQCFSINRKEKLGFIPELAAEYRSRSPSE